MLNRPALYVPSFSCASRTALIHPGMDKILLGVSHGVWHRDLCSRSFGSHMMRVGHPWNGTCSRKSHRCSMLGSWELRGQVNIFSSLPQSLGHSWSVSVTQQSALYCWGGGGGGSQVESSITCHSLQAVFNYFWVLFLLNCWIFKQSELTLLEI